MKKFQFEIFENNISTVEDLINILVKVPKKYSLSCTGVELSIGVDNSGQFLLFDELDFLNSHLEELKEESSNRDIEIEIPDEELDTYMLFALISYSVLSNNGNEEANFEGIFSSIELAEKKGQELVSNNLISNFEIVSSKINE